MVRPALAAENCRRQSAAGGATGEAQLVVRQAARKGEWAVGTGCSSRALCMNLAAWLWHCGFRQVVTLSARRDAATGPGPRRPSAHQGSQQQTGCRTGFAFQALGHIDAGGSKRRAKPCVAVSPPTVRRTSCRSSLLCRSWWAVGQPGASIDHRFKRCGGQPRACD